MSTIDRDRLVRVSRELEVVFILILVGSVAQQLEAVNSFEWLRTSSSKPTEVIRPTRFSMLLHMARAHVRLISLFSGNARKRVR
jgi:hypothetical protein